MEGTRKWPDTSVGRSIARTALAQDPGAEKPEAIPDPPLLFVGCFGTSRG